MNNYELVLVFTANSSPEDQKKIISKIEKSAKITSQEEWGKKPLAYVIGKNTEGSYLLLKLTSEAVAADKLDNLLRVEDKLIRYLLIKKE